jgi:serine/threonine-protein kinase
MEMTNLGACEWFVWDLRRSHLLDPAKLDEVVGQFLGQKPEGEPPALAEYLVDQGLLTPFQSERLLQGKSQDLVLGPFVLVAALGSGSMGTVYRASSKRNKGWFAVKVLPRRSMWNARMARRLVSAFEKFKHPAVVPFVDVGTAGAMHYLAWPLVEGETLESLVRREGKLDPDRAAQFALQVAEGLEVCHQNSLVHGMIKPSNLMVGPDQQVHILDFGIASLLAQDEGESLVDTRSTANVFTSGLDCVSPESIVDPSQRTPAGDQYSLGCVLYFCLAGNYPFAEATAAEKIFAHQMKQPTPIREISPNVPESLAAIVDHLMQKTPEARYANMGDLIAALREPGRSAEPEVSGQPDTVIEIPPLPVLSADAAEPVPAEAPGQVAAELAETAPAEALRQAPPPEAEVPAPAFELPAPGSHPALAIAPPAMEVAQVTASPSVSEPAPAHGVARPSAPTDYSLFDIPGVENPLEAKIAEMRKSWVFPLPELNAKLQALMQPATQQVNLPAELPPVLSSAPPAAPPESKMPQAAPWPNLPLSESRPTGAAPRPLPPKAEQPMVVAAPVAPPPPPPVYEPRPVPVVQPAPETPAYAPGSISSQAALAQEQIRPVWLMVGGLILFVLIFFLGIALFPH